MHCQLQLMQEKVPLRFLVIQQRKLHSAKKGVRIQSPLSRKPLSPVSSTVLSKANIKNSIQNVATKPIPQKSEELTGTPPSKPFITGIEDSVPSTPLTVHKLNITTPDS